MNSRFALKVQRYLQFRHACGGSAQFCELDGAGDSLVPAIMSQLTLFARGFHRVLKLAHTIADLAGYETVHSLIQSEE